VLADTHAHLDFEDFNADRDEVLRRAADAGVRYIIVPGIDVRTTRAAIALAERYDMVYAAAGVHPNETALAESGDMDEIQRLAAHPKVVAIGETGLDNYRDRSPRDMQARLFREHLDIAREMNLPVIIHFRDAGYADIERTGTEYFERVRGVFHSFGGSPELAEQLAGMGFFIGFTGPLTYKKSDRIEPARITPLERILIETDSPFLSPRSHRGSRNEPAFVVEIADKLAEIKGLDRAAVIASTGENARRLFGIGA
jgi:TatD DNase family protein